ncbi:MAG: acetyl-CoA carboxylase biotin carboxylase subunit [Gemmatimonadota bacterium]|nr:acetyl-CoA carboxylase biotin carboxylase subunit [Gemmatimonadota bacterium]
MIRRVLIANRGEIAVRIARACREAGIGSAAVYAEVDRDAPHVWACDRALGILAEDPRRAYLAIASLIDAARALEADAVHPGYGFLAENAEFARAVSDAGLTWIGPPADAIRAMGEKTAARRTMERSGVPVIPGSVDAVGDAGEAERRAEEIGYPVLLKAAAGGGGKGMRVVSGPEELAAAFRGASGEAKSAFGDPALYLETYLPEARHVEIQVVADGDGRTIHLGERECSLQRRHQKILEEAPAPGLDEETRSEMGAVAVRAAEAVGYVGAGTVEFLLAPDGSFWFLEMNTRLQVEHPVTEWVTGLDLVALQLAIAAGEPLPITQEDVSLRGHAVECRIAAEDPAGGFLPDTGTVTAYREPAGPGVRFDSGIAAGVEVTSHFDPLLAKCIVWGRTREEALARQARALEETIVGGLTTNVAFHRALLEDPAVREGRTHTAWLERHADRVVERMEQRRDADAPLAAALAALRTHLGPPGASRPRPAPSGGRDAWRRGARWTGLR